MEVSADDKLTVAEIKRNNLAENIHVGKSENAQKEHLRPYSQGLFGKQDIFVYFLGKM